MSGGTLRTGSRANRGAAKIEEGRRESIGSRIGVVQGLKGVAAEPGDGLEPRERAGRSIAHSRLELALQEGVLQGKARLVQEHLEHLQAAELGSGVRVVSEEESDRLAVGEQRKERHGP